jgi:hypothetical protein
MDPAPVTATQVEILAYAPTEFYHCQHCEAVWQHLGIGRAVHAEQRDSALPPDLQAEYDQIADWVGAAAERYGPRLAFRLVDAASAEGVWKSLRYRCRRFPAFIVDGERIAGFDRSRLDAALAAHIGAAPARAR